MFSAETPCRSCGCTDSNACIHPVRGACFWVEDDLCSECTVKTERRRSWVGGFATGAAAMFVLVLVAAGLTLMVVS